MNRRQVWPHRCKPHIYYRNKRWVMRAYNGITKRVYAIKVLTFSEAASAAQSHRLN